MLMAANSDTSSGTVSTTALVGLVLLLAGLDLIGSMLAKEWGIGRNPWFFGAGAISFVVLFAVYAAGLKYADMSTVTFGWIVVVQVSILVVERLRYGVELPAGKWAALVGICILQGYLLLAPGTQPRATEPTAAEPVSAPILQTTGSAQP